MESCKNWTDFIDNLQDKAKSIDQFLGSEQFEDAQMQIEEIEDLILDKKEFLQWMLGVEAYEFRPSQEERESAYDEFPFFDVSDNGEYLVFGTGEKFTLINLENEKTEFDNIELVSNQGQNVLINYYRVSNSGEVYINAQEKIDDFGLLETETYFIDSWRTVLNPLFSDQTPMVFDRHISVASFESGKLSEVSSATDSCLKGLDYDNRDYGGVPFDRIEVCEPRKFAYTINENNELDQWDMEDRNHMRTVASGVQDFMILPGDSNFIILSNFQLYHYQIESDPDSMEDEVTSENLSEEYEDLYEGMAKSPDNKYLFALTGENFLDVFDLEKMEKVIRLNLSKELGGLRFESMRAGVDNRIVIKASIDEGFGVGSSEHKVLVFRSKWRDDA